MSNGWRRIKLMEVAANKKWAMNGGPFGSKLSTKHYAESGVPVIRGGNLSGAMRFSLGEFVYVSEEKADELLPNNAHPGDLIFTQRGTIGQVGLIPRTSPFSRFVISQSQMKLTPDPEKADAVFLYHYFSSPDTVVAIKNLAFSAGVPHINLDILRNFEIQLPPLLVQQRIAAVLSAYDSMIENNLRRIEILEEMARTIYRQWFVEFRFPGQPRAPRSSTQGRTAPKGWALKKLSEIASVNRAKISARSAPSELHYIDISSVSPGRIDHITSYPFSAAPGRARRVVQHGDVIWSCVRPNLKAHALIMRPRPDTIASTGFAVLTAERVPFSFLHLATTTDDFVSYLTNHATGAAYPAVTAKTFADATFLVPPTALLREFDDLANPMAEQIAVLQDQARTLRFTRDLLLPLLLSGQISLSDKILLE